MVGPVGARSTSEGTPVNIWSYIDLFQPACAVCGLGAATGLPLCGGCRADLPFLASACEHCALPLPAGPDGLPARACPHCRRRQPPVTRAVAACRYAFPVDRLVQHLKFGGQLPLARVLGDVLADRVRAAYASDRFPEALVAVPLHPRRQRQRGFNQAGRIAAAAGRELGVPLLEGAVARVRNTAAQSGLELRVRRRNLRGAFVVTGTLPAHVAIVDDVVTSGSTVLALADTLRAAGVVRVDAWAVARTI